MKREKKRTADTIIIIGNGFDICHGLPSRYSDFKAWLQVNNLELYETLNRYIDISGDWWNEFERNLASFHVPKLIYDAQKDYPQQDPGFLPTFNHPVNGFFRMIRKHLAESFTEWAKTLSCDSAKPILELPDANLYISFNYTDMLGMVYGIPESEILYIHGKASRRDDLIFGHSKSHFEMEEEIKKKYGLYRNPGIRGTGTSIHAFMCLKKCV